LIPIAKRFAKSEHLDIVFAGDAPEGEQRALIAQQELGAFPFVNGSELGRVFGVDKLPHAALIDERGVIVSRGLVNSREHLESLLEARDLKLASVQDYLRQRAESARPSVN
jgi:methylamine dehydrogenase accessory protein MauD